MKKGLLGLLALVVVCSCGEQKKDNKKAPIRVKTEVVSPTSDKNGQTYVGIIEEREATAVSFTGMGVVKRVLVDEGQAVGRGQLLAEMDDTQARNLLSGAEAQMAQANDALQRYQMLHDNGSLPEVQWVEIQSKVAQARSQLEVARKNLSDCRLVAPVNGIVGHKMVGAGETALPSQAVVTILDVNTVKVKVAVPEAEVGSIAANTRSHIQVDAVNRSYEGGHIEKGITADALTHTYDIRINVQNSEHKLLPGMVASVTFGMEKREAKSEPSASASPEMKLYVPVSAVQKQADGSLFVWTVSQDSTAHRTVIGTGAAQGNRISITEGVENGQRIVTEGYQKLSEGTKVVY